MRLSVERVLTICSNGCAPLYKMAAMPIYGKILNTLLLQTHESFETESLYIVLRVASGHRVKLASCKSALNPTPC